MEFKVSDDGGITAKYDSDGSDSTTKKNTHTHALYTKIIIYIYV